MAIISKKLSAETNGESSAQNLPLGREPKKKWFDNKCISCANAVQQINNVFVLPSYLVTHATVYSCGKCTA